MFVKITHRGLNRRKDASKLHQMIAEGYHHRFIKDQKIEEKPEEPTPEDKQAFIEAVQQEENAILLGGLKYG
jgi:hypothetical protein